MSDCFFSVVFDGEIRQDLDISEVKPALADLLKIDLQRVDKLFENTPVTIKREIDFIGGLKYVKAFKQAGACCRLEITGEKSFEVVAPSSESHTEMSETNAQAIASVEKARWIFEEVEKRLEWIKELNEAIEKIRREQSGAWGQKRLAYNVKLNEVWNERTEKMADLIKKDKEVLREQIKKLKIIALKFNPGLQDADFTNPRFRSGDSGAEDSPLNQAMQSVHRSYNLIRQIELYAQVSNVDPASGASKSGCFIATAVYGGSRTPQVQILRRFRDECLQHSRRGRAFIRFYYKVSPPVACIIAKTVWLKRLIRTILDALVRKIGYNGGDDVG